jgi:capsular polysaccharide biosynthesis protein
MNSHRVDAEEKDVREQLGSVLAFLKRTANFWPTPVIALTVGIVAASVFLYLRKPTYRSETVILYSQGTGGGDAAEQSAQPRSVTVRLKELLMSRRKLERVVAEFALYPDVRRAYGMADGVDELKKHIDFRAPGGDTFSIAFEGTSPSQAQRITTRLAQLVIDEDAGLRKKQASVARDFLVSEKGKTETKLRGAEQELASFMAEHPRFALDATPLTTGAAIRASVASGTSRGTAIPASAAGFRHGSVGPRTAASEANVAQTASREIVRDPNGEEARASAALAAARADLAEQLGRYTAAHPDVRAAGASVERAQGRLALLTTDSNSKAPATLSPVTNGTKPPEPARIAPKVPRPTAPPMVRNGVAADPREGDVVVLETQWSRLTRGVTEARQRQDQVETQLFKADILASSESGGHGLQMTVIDPAFFPARAVPPGRTTLAAVFLALSLVLGVLGALLRAFLDDRIYERRDAARFAEVLVEVPRLSKHRRAYVRAS